MAILNKCSLFGFPNKRVLTILSSFLVKIFTSIVATFSFSSENNYVPQKKRMLSEFFV